jgi:hypothetical protein
MLERLAPKLVTNIHDIELLEYIGTHFHPGPLLKFDKFHEKILGERELFRGDSVDYLALLVEHLNGTFKKFLSLGGLTRSRGGAPVAERTFASLRNFSSVDQFVLRGIVTKLSDKETFTLLKKPLSAASEHFFTEVRENSFTELANFKSPHPFAYFLLQLMQVHVALAEVIALHKFGPKG